MSARKLRMEIIKSENIKEKMGLKGSRTSYTSYRRKYYKSMGTSKGCQRREYQH
jgi:hypothetical protein